MSCLREEEGVGGRVFLWERVEVFLFVVDFLDSRVGFVFYTSILRESTLVRYVDIRFLLYMGRDSSSSSSSSSVVPEQESPRA